MGFLAQFAQSSSSYDSLTDEQVATGVIIASMFVFFIFIILIITYVINSYLLGRIFKKAGVDQWIAWVPFYNTWKTLELGGQQGFWAVLAIVPVVNIVSAIFIYIAMYNIGLKLQKEGWFVLFAIFLPIVWMAWLAFDSSTWREHGGAQPVKPRRTVKS